MEYLSVEFIGGDMDGQSRSPTSESEILALGYQIALRTHPKGDELTYCVAVPSGLTKEEAHREVMSKLNPRSRPRPGKKSA